MAELIVLSWRDIPAQVIARSGRKSAKRELSKRFIESIDRVAMRTGARDDDAYLADWHRGDPRPCGDDLDFEVDAEAARLETIYDDVRLKALVASGGRET